MEKALVRIHVGPCYVNLYAEKVRAAGFEVVTEGTEHLYVKMDRCTSGWGIVPACAELDEKVGFYISKGACVIS